ncbi:MAG: GntR family transcriptional regulator [Bacteroidetes bacterium 43-16]|nr:MAG: GntR family transcriptional regulator [Bacteroidetes bacterium 43-16]
MGKGAGFKISASPVCNLLQRIILLQRESSLAIFIQIANQVTHAIQQGLLVPGQKMPGTRALADVLKVHRNTVTAAYEELYALGWLQIRPNKGAFVIPELPLVNKHKEELPAYPAQTGFSFKTSIILDSFYEHSTCDYLFTEGTPDIRLTQITDLSRLYTSNMKRKSNRKKMSYYFQEGSRYFKQHLCNYLNATRGLKIAEENILITRSIEMNLFIISEILLQQEDYVVVSNPGYFAANMAFHKQTKNILTVPVDEEGLNVRELEALCKTYPIRLVYVIPQNHYPTTVNLSAARRMSLLQLSQRYGFIIVEDDHDYDFHYEHQQVLPLATVDTSGMVIYIGSFGKSLVPGFRTGFIVAPQNLMKEMRKFLGIIDRQGDVLMEQALGEMIEDGGIQRHIKKSIKAYKERRDKMTGLLHSHLAAWISFLPPSGGLAFWVVFKKKINLIRLREQCAANNLFLPRNILYQDRHTTAMRLGFGHLEEQELEVCISILKRSLEEMEEYGF